MRKSIAVFILCLVLSASALSFAEQYPREAVFDGFSVVCDGVKKSGGKFTIQLSALFSSETDAKYYTFSLLPKDSTGEGSRYMTPEEVRDYYEGFLKGVQVYSSAEKEPRRLTPEEIEKLYPAGVTPYPDRAFVLVRFKTLSGEEFAPDGSFDMLEFGTFQEPEQRKDGKWYVPVVFEATNFSTKEQGVLLEFYIHDPLGDAPFTGDVEQTMYIAIQ